MIIEDKLIDPFYIRDDDASWALVERRIARSGKNKGSKIDVTIGWFLKIESVLERIIDLKIKRRHVTRNLEEFVRELKSDREAIISALNL